MRDYNDNYSDKLVYSVKKPESVIQIAFDDAETDLIYLRTSANAPVPGGATVYTILTKDPTSITQKIDPLKGTATIGHSSFSVIDPGGTLTTKINDKLGSSKGLRGKLARFYRGYEGLAWSDMEPRVTQIVKSVSFDPKTGEYKFSCEDIQRSLKKDIFEIDTCELSKAVTATQTHIPVTIPTTSSVFNEVEHDNAYLERPGETCGYIILDKEVICHTGFFTHGTDGTSFQVATDGRGALNTTALAHEIPEPGADERPPEIKEWIYFEGAIPKIAYAILTGNSIGETADFPWNMEIDSGLVRQADFTGIGDDLWNTSDDFGQMCRFENPKPQDAKKFIETELMMLLPGFMPVYSSGELGLKRLTGVISDAAPVAELTNSMITKITALNHDMPNTVNKFRVDWNYIASTDKPSKHTVMIDADSITTHGATNLKTFKFRGMHTGRQTDETLRNQFNSLRSRHAGPPMLLKADTFLYNEALEVGDIVNVKTDKIRDWNTGGTLNRAMEIQQISYKPDGVSISLFGSSAKAGAIDNGPASSRLPDTYYTGSGTDLNSVLTISGGAITSNGNLAGGVYYYDGDLTLNSGITVTFNATTTLKIKGDFQELGKLDGKGRGDAGGNGQTSTSAQPTVANGWFGATRGGCGVMFWDAYDFGAFFTDVINYPLATKGHVYSVPALSLDLEDGVFTGVPTDTAGTGGRGGSAALYKNRAGTISHKANGGAGGDGGAGIIIISRGMAFGPSADIDVSGDDGDIGIQASQSISYPNGELPADTVDYTFSSGSGAGGSPGTVIVLIDGNNTPPVLSSYVTANLGNSPLSPGNTQVPAGGKKYALTYDEGDELFSWNQGYQATSMINACTAVQYVPDDQTVEEEIDQLHQLDAPTGVTATPYTGEAVTVTSAGNRMQPVEVTWTQNADPDCIGYEVKAKRTADTNYRTVILTRSSSEIRGNYNQQQGDEYSIQARCISSAEQHSDWTTIAYTAPLTTDIIKWDDVSAPIGNLIPDPFFERTPSAYDATYWSNLSSNAFYQESGIAGAAGKGLVFYDLGTYRSTSSINNISASVGKSFAFNVKAFSSVSYNSLTRVFMSCYDSSDTQLTTVYSPALMTPNEWKISDFNLTIPSPAGDDTTYIKIGIDDNASGSAGYVFIDHVLCVPLIDFGAGVGGTERPEDNATVGGQLGTDVKDELGSVIDDLEALNENQSWSEVSGQQYVSVSLTSGAIVIYAATDIGIPFGATASPNTTILVGDIITTRYGDAMLSCSIKCGGPTDLSTLTYTVKVLVNAAEISSTNFASVAKGDSILHEEIITSLEPDDEIKVNLVIPAYGGSWDGIFTREGIGIYSDNAHRETIDGEQI